MAADGGAVAAAGELTEALRAEIERKMGGKKAYFNNWDALGDAGAVFVAEKLCGNTDVELLVLSNCGIGAAGARALGKSLGEDNVTLKILILSKNRVDDDGAESMAQMLRKNTTLEALYLNACDVGARGACALFEALKEVTSLKRLDFEDNGCMKEDGAKLFADALRENESLEILNLRGCQLTDVGALSLLSALRESNSTVMHFNINVNDDITDSTTMASIRELLLENKAVWPASAERRARCLLFCCLQLAPTAHEHAVPSIGAVPVPVMQYAVEHAGKLHVAKRFEVGNFAFRESSAGVRVRSSSSSSDSDLQPAAARRR